MTSVTVKPLLELSRVATLREALMAATVRLNDVLMEAEAAINGLRLGVRAEVVIESEPVGKELLLVFGKYNDKWQVFFVKHVNANEEEVTLMMHATRSWRIKAADHLEALVLAMFAAAGKETDRLNNKADQVVAFVGRTKGIP